MDLLPESCAGCGKCCYPFVPVLPGDTWVPQELTENRTVGVKTRKVMREVAVTNPAYRDAGYTHCIALDPKTHLCTIYDRRPSICQDFERGGSVCLQMLGEFRQAAADLGPL